MSSLILRQISGFQNLLKEQFTQKYKCDVYLQGIQDAGDFVSSVEHKRRCLTQSVSHLMEVNGLHGFESQKKHTQTKPN